MTLMIASHQRAGSSNLARFLRKCAGINLRLEPFNRKRLKKNLPGRRSDEDLRRYIDKTLTDLDGFKHIYGQQKPELDLYLYHHRRIHTIIILCRQDVLAAALSAAIARKSRNFISGADTEIGRIDPSSIFAIGDELRAKAKDALEAAKSSGKPFIHVYYEDLFSGDVSMRIERAKQILDFTGLDPLYFDEAFYEYLDVDKKINKVHNYENIENWKELEKLIPSFTEQKNFSFI